MRPLLIFLLFSLSLWAGVARFTVVKGDVYVKRGDVTQVATKGFELEEKDRVETGDKAKAQIIFTDETVITLGKNTDFSINEYLDEAGKEKASFGITKGFFKSMTGKIGSVAPDKFKLKTRTATMGIRGTHFVGNISEQKELFGCTGGAIYVESEGKRVDLFAGEMVTVVPGKVPSTPVELNLREIEQSAEAPSIEEITAKIKAIVLRGDSLKFDKEAIMAVLNDIAKIQEDDIRRGLEDSLNDYLNIAFKNGLFERFNKTDASIAIDPGGTQTATYTPLTWGVVTYRKPDTTGTFYQNVSDAVPIQTYYELPDGTVPTATDTATIAGMMGSTDGTTIPAHWDGSGGTRQLVKFEGSVLAVSDANVFSDSDNQFPNDYDLDKFSVISPDAASNQVNITVDFGSRLWYGTIDFDIDKDGVTENWEIAMGSIGSSAVNPTGLQTLKTYYTSDSIATADGYVWRFYGDNVEQLGGYFNLVRDEGDGASSSVVGSIIANNVETVELSTKSMGVNANFEWGYWAESDFASSSPSDSEILAANPHGAWINATGVSQTDAKFIQGYIDSTTGITASYSGSVYGTIHDTTLVSNNVALMDNGSVALDFDFTAQTVNGTIGFDEGVGGTPWGVNIKNGSLDSSGFLLTSASNTLATDNQANINYFEGSGKFYGSEADHIGGGFEMGASDGKFAIGAFNAQRQ